MPLITPRKLRPSAVSVNFAVTSLPFNVKRIWLNVTPAGAFTSTSASPPLTRSGRDDRILMSSVAAFCANALLALKQLIRRAKTRTGIRFSRIEAARVIAVSFREARLSFGFQAEVCSEQSGRMIQSLIHAYKEPGNRCQACDLRF